MNEEEKQAIKELQNKHIFFSEYEAIEDYETENNINTILNLIDKQQEEIKARLEEIDSLYKMMSAKDDKIEQMKEDYQILKDDIEGHKVVYVDTPEFEENYISKDKIRHIRDKAECMDYYSLNDVIDDLSKLLGDENNE